MNLSRNEVEATLLKAARGQKMPLGHTDLFAKAAVRALGEDPSHADQVTVALRGPHLHADFENARVAMAGPAALDALICGEAEIALSHVDAPAVLSAMVFNYNENMDLKVDIKLISAGASLLFVNELPTQTCTKGPLIIPSHHWQLWLSWAAETYVPETDVSRLGGAGAGLTDND